MKTILMIAILGLLTLSVSAQPADPPPKRFGAMAYPAPGNFDLDEGTVELWVSVNADTDDKKFGGATLFDLFAPKGEGFHYPIMFVGGSIAQIGFCKPRQSYVWWGKAGWKAGEQHYVVFTWSGRSRSLFIDGKHNESPQSAPLQGEGRGRFSNDVLVEGWLSTNLTGSTLVAGAQYSPITLDEIRISSVAKSEKELAAIYAAGAAPKREATTLLLDHCDGGPAEVISGFSGEKGAEFRGEYKVVDGRFGKAIQLWTQP